MKDGVIEVKVQGMAQIVKAFNRSPQTVEPIMQRAITTVADILAKHTVPGVVPYRTGFLVQTFERRVGRLMAAWYPTRHYAPYVEFGTRFMKANPYMERILSRGKPEINDVFTTSLRLATERIAEDSRS